jgi:hypothetical protein
MYLKQESLFDDLTTEAEKSISDGKAALSDPAFAINKTLPLHRWVPWVAGFSRNFVIDAIDRYLPQSGYVLDPFAGVGTTLVEAALRGHRAVGFEINPYAALACQTKLQAITCSIPLLQRAITAFQVFYYEKLSSDYIPNSAIPTGFKTRGVFYSPQVLRKVLILQDFIAALTEPTLQNVFKLAFAATMIRYSNYSYEPSLGRRESSGKEAIQDFPVGETVISKLREMLQDIAWLQEQAPATYQTAQVFADSFFQYQRYLPPESIDLIVTSPPYLNNYHYLRNTRPQLYWLGFASSPKDVKYLETANFGKYWQTVREQEPLELQFSLPESDLLGCLSTLRSLHLEKGIYGGNGWANYATAYFNDCYSFALAIKDLLKPGGTALIVIGNSILQGIMIPTDRYLGEIAASVGLTVAGIDIPRSARVGSSIIQSSVRVGKAKESQQLYEAIVHLQKL